MLYYSALEISSRGRLGLMEDVSSVICVYTAWCAAESEGLDSDSFFVQQDFLIALEIIGRYEAVEISLNSPNK
jgi:hypothetical protein